MKSQMTRRERILAALSHQETDRLPTDYWGVPEATEKLKRRFGVKTFEEVCDILRIDYMQTVEPKFLGRPESSDNMWGITNKTIKLRDGSEYQEPVEFPIGKYETVDEIEANYVWPTTDMFDYSVIPGQIRQKQEFAIKGGYISLTYFYEIIRGTEQMLIDFISDKPLAEYVLFKLQEFSYAHTKKILEAGGGRIDASEVTDDLGSQNGLIMGMDMIDGYLSGYYDDNIKLVKSCGAKVFHHDDGAMTDALPWLIQKGIDVLNPLQWHLPKWDLAELKKTYGRQICFHGGVDNQAVLPFGTPEDVGREVNACAEALYRDRTGYILAPCHNIQGFTPVENIIAMYEAASRI